MVMYTREFFTREFACTTMFMRCGHIAATVCKFRCRKLCMDFPWANITTENGMCKSVGLTVTSACTLACVPVKSCQLLACHRHGDWAIPYMTRASSSLQPIIIKRSNAIPSHKFTYRNSNTIYVYIYKKNISFYTGCFV